MPRFSLVTKIKKKRINMLMNLLIIFLPEGQEQEIGICTKILGSNFFSIKLLSSTVYTLVETIGVARKNLKKSRQFVSGIDKFVIISKI